MLFECQIRMRLALEAYYRGISIAQFQGLYSSFIPMKTSQPGAEANFNNLGNGTSGGNR